MTGGPSVGKTTIISLLEQSGFPVIREQATLLIREAVYLPWEDRDRFQMEVLRRQLAVEERYLRSDTPVFLDRGLFDGEAYYITDGMTVPPVFQELDASRYSMAFLIEELPFFDNNGVRFENLEFTRRITPIVERCYTSRGVPVTRVPALSPQERVDLVLEAVASLSRQPACSLDRQPLPQLAFAT